MPRRTETSAKSASTRTVAKTAPRQRETNSGDDVWEEIENMKSGYGDGFNKMNTNFYLQEGDEIDVVFLDEKPYVFWGHTIKCRSSKGKTFYQTEQCQKAVQDYCVLCDSDNKAISKEKRIIAFRILDSRGTWDTKKGGFDGVPCAKIFLVPLYLAKQLKTLKDDGDGILTDKVVKLKKSSNYQANFKMKKGEGGAMYYVDAPDFDGDVPDVLEVYAPMSDNELIDFINRFADAPSQQPASNTAASARRGGQNIGSFGD